MMSSDVEKNVANLNELVNLNENDFVDQLQKIPSFFSKQNEFVLLEQIIPKLLDIFNMKSKKNKYDEVYEVAKQMILYVNEWYTPYIADKLSSIINDSMLAKKKYSYMLLHDLIKEHPNQIKISMPELIPMVSSDVNDIVASIKESASSALEIILKCSGNIDLDAFVPAVLMGIKSGDKIYDAVEAFTLDSNEMGNLVAAVDLDGNTVEAVVAEWMSNNKDRWGSWIN